MSVINKRKISKINLNKIPEDDSPSNSSEDKTSEGSDNSDNSPENKCSECDNPKELCECMFSPDEREQFRKKSKITRIPPNILNTLLSNNSKKNSCKNKIKTSDIPENIKEKLLNQLDENLDDKRREWFDTVLTIPFNKRTKIPVDITNKGEITEYFNKCMKSLDDSVYGLKDVKEEIIAYIAQTITSKNPNHRIIALNGSAGIGKTKIVREGIAKSLNTPIQYFSMGGIKDSQHFVGFDYTYSHSRCGSIVKSLINSGVCNPIFFFDELDKISTTHEGKDIENLLIHLTDPVQNNDFRDKYIGDISIDLSNVLFIFSFNNIENINPILLDRLYIIDIPSPCINDKIIITKNYIIDELLGNFSLTKEDFDISDDAIKHIILKYPNHNGMRQIKRAIESILLKINLIKLLGKDIESMNLSFKNYNKDNNKDNSKKDKELQFPIKITTKNIDEFIHFKEDETECKNPYMYI